MKANKIHNMEYFQDEGNIDCFDLFSYSCSFHQIKMEGILAFSSSQHPKNYK
jgi:hypothetical protein